MITYDWFISIESNKKNDKNCHFKHSKKMLYPQGHSFSIHLYNWTIVYHRMSINVHPSINN